MFKITLTVIGYSESRVFSSGMRMISYKSVLNYSSTKQQPVFIRKQPVQLKFKLIGLHDYCLKYLDYLSFGYTVLFLPADTDNLGKYRHCRYRYDWHIPASFT